MGVYLEVGEKGVCPLWGSCPTSESREGWSQLVVLRQPRCLGDAEVLPDGSAGDTWVTDADMELPEVGLPRQ